MFSPRTLLILLGLIYVTHSQDEDTSQSFSLEKATKALKHLVDESLKKLANYGAESKKKLKEWKNRITKGGGNFDEDIKDLELMLNHSITNDFKEKENKLYDKLIDLTKNKQNAHGKFQKLYDQAKNILSDAKSYWKKQWNAATDLFKSEVQKTPVTVDQKEVNATVEEGKTKKSFFQRFKFLKKIPLKLRKIYREQVEKLKRLARAVKEKIRAKINSIRAKFRPQPTPISNQTVEHRPLFNESKSEDLDTINPAVIHKTYQVDKLINNNIDTLTDLWTQSEDDNFKPPNFSQFYDKIYNKVNRLIDDIVLKK